MKALVLDKESLYSFFGDNPEDIKEILNDYINNSGKMKQDLLESYKQTPAELYHCLHFNSAAFTYTGLPELTVVFKELSRKCNTIKANNEIEAEFNNVLEMLDSSVLIVKNEVENIENNLNTSSIAV
jgi:hypothetical protein